MRYSVFHCSRKGATHEKQGLPKQDASQIFESDELRIAVCADGHGSRRHFRSERGAEIACAVTLELIRKYVSGDSEFIFSDVFFDELIKNIVDEWRNRIYEYAKGNPLTDEEKEEQIQLLSDDQLQSLLDGSDVFIPYGTTLCAVFLCNAGWGAIQIGDGCLTVVNRNNEFVWPMPPSSINAGNKTASLCMKDPFVDFRHCYSTDIPVALVVYTDGIEKCFPDEGEEIISFLSWIIRNEQNDKEERERNLANNLDILSKRGRTGDDATIAGIIDITFELMEPKMTLIQTRKEIGRLNAQIKEIEHTVRYNMEKIKNEDPNGNTYQQLESIISRKKEQLQLLLKKRKELCESIGETHSEEDITKYIEMVFSPVTDNIGENTEQSSEIDVERETIKKENDQEEAVVDDDRTRQMKRKPSLQYNDEVDELNYHLQSQRDVFIKNVNSPYNFPYDALFRILDMFKELDDDEVFFSFPDDKSHEI